MHNNKSRVFVTQEVKSGKKNIDYAPARKFGDIKFLTIMDYSSENSSIFNKVLIEELRSRLRDYDPESDYIVVTGSPLVAAVVFMILRERCTQINFLRWSNRIHEYDAVTINLV